MSEGQPTYAEAVAEIEGILEEIESGQLDIDALAPRVERAAALIRSCRSVLDATEMRVTRALSELTEALDGDEP